LRRRWCHQSEKHNQTQRAISAVHAPLVSAGNPISGIAGTSGNSAVRFGPTIASPPQFPILDQLQRRAHSVEGHLHFARHDGSKRGTAALIRHMQDVCPTDRLEQFGIQMRQRSNTARRIIKFARVFLDISDKLGNRFERQLRIDHQHLRCFGNERHWCEA
jgi:hypothetical protein